MALTMSPSGTTGPMLTAGNRLQTPMGRTQISDPDKPQTWPYCRKCLCSDRRRTGSTMSSASADGRRGVTCRNPTTDRQNARRLYAPTMMRVALVSTRWPSNVISRKREPTHRDWPELDAQCHGSKRRASDLLATLRRRELDAVAAGLSAETAMPYRPAAQAARRRRHLPPAPHQLRPVPP
jgi:hypothetical protein